MTRTVNYFEAQVADLVDLTIAPMFVGFWWLFVIEAVCLPLRPRNANPRRLTRQLIVNRFVRRMDNDLRFRLSLFQPGNATYVIHVRMRAGDGLQFKAVFVNRLDNSIRIVARIDAD